MLEGAFSSPKIRRLAVIIGVPWPHALGVAALLWRFAAKHAQTGEVGRHDDEEIAAALEWPDDGTALVEALARCRLLDRVPGPARYIVHDWPDHSPRYVLAALKKKGMNFSRHYEEMERLGVSSTDDSTDDSTDGSAEPSPFTSSSSSTSTSSSTNTPTSSGYLDWRVDEERMRAIFDSYLDGRRVGWGSSLAVISEGVRRYAIDNDCSIDQALRVALRQTEKDVNAYKKLIESGETELKYVPTASTYFRRQRWLTNEDDIPEPTKKKEVSIDDEIAEARARRGS